ncbi:hypothetical protein BC829DRAFT_397847 [Chytridium lagenaria]|nr:hypothetical protein BC829DRAFT_397847 [Chytridium lagenaria]
MASKAGKLAIAVAKGDGIGPEIMDATLKIFEAAQDPHELTTSSRWDWQIAKAIVEKHGILFKGPMETPKGGGMKSINVWSAYTNKRVFKSLPGVETVFSRSGINIDLTLFRENIEDTYGGIEHYQTHDVAQTRRLITRPGSLQIHKMAFEVAHQKNAKRITCCHKANIHKLTDGLFLSTFYEIAKQYPHIKADDTIVDDLAMKLVMDPRRFDIIVLPNLQGDIMSDLCAGLVGGLGMAPSANLGDRINIFEAVHGTAPDIAGKNMANPTALLISGLMMLRHVNMADRADHIQKALEVTLAEGDRTVDLTQIPGHKPLGTSEFASCPSSSFAFTVGLDIFVDSALHPKPLAEVIQSVIPKESGLELVMISNRGTQVVNHYRCRLEIKDGEKASAAAARHRVESDLLLVASKLAKSALLEIDGKKMYSLAQGQ